ncbi:membrane protein [Neosynechococcus sphagnicola sy1]|uniref:Membrane protein n=1 Tax=Neosynechococcus sphagnicola sy1 TaxID=1497020 RepID=A0A098TI10_9CYAN|nr:phosphate-starvation-inducible PsiE family protein [Neosynechococcus sphagnicola]KGF71754.1 membrane protein [Neosynechococcus sphagnicola sy1]
MVWLKHLLAAVIEVSINDEQFIKLLKKAEGIASRILALGMLVVILSATFDLGWILVQQLSTPPLGRISGRLVEIFGLFLNVLIALEILENITAYLKTDVSSQIVEMVIVTSLIAVARKIIILDIDQPDTVGKLVGLAVAIFAISISYWIVRVMNLRQRRP